MFITGHVGISLGILSIFVSFGGQKNFLALNPFLIIFFALVPDIIDKTIALFFISKPESFRLWAHSLSFFLFLYISISLIYRKLKIYVWFTMGHLLLDGMWNQPHTFLYPFLGFQFDPTPVPIVEKSFEKYLHWIWNSILSDPLSLYMEFIGISGIFVYIIMINRFKKERK
jgi:hypothetical protein